MNNTANRPEQSSDQHPHRHGFGCWWHAQQARWVCAPDTASAPSAGSTAGQQAGAPDPELVDVRDMIVVHTALLREFRLAPDDVCRVPLGDRGRAAKVERHLGLLCDLLHHHHEGEDELLWPPLRSRLPERGQALLDEAESQHAGLDAALSRVGAARQQWTQRVDAESRDALVAALGELHHLLAVHPDAEERTLLPLAAAHLSEAEWRVVGDAGAASVPKSAMPLVFGMFMYEGDPQVLASMLSAAPAPVRALVPLVAPRVYARRARQIHGTARP